MSKHPKIRHTGEGAGPVAAIIYFEDGVPLVRAEKMLEKLADKVAIRSITAGRYNPEYGAPVWYIP